MIIKLIEIKIIQYFSTLSFFILLNIGFMDL
jgi:hypothetical protein